MFIENYKKSLIQDHSLHKIFRAPLKQRRNNNQSRNIDSTNFTRSNVILILSLFYQYIYVYIK